jgi:voltage-gated potassium channel
MDFKKLWRSLLMLMGIILFGTVSYVIVENMSLFESLYMTIITISTVGFSEIRPLSPLGRMITLIVIIMGISVGTYTIGSIVRVFVESELRTFFGRRMLEKRISTLKGHYIICGFGRIGQIICEELSGDNIAFIVIEQNEEAIKQLELFKYVYLNMDATSEEALKKAGIMTAKGIVTAVSSDADNVFIALTAKGIRPDIYILSRASEEKNEPKLIRAGATRVMSPYMIGARRMAQLLKRPTVVDFIDIATMGNSLGLMMEEAEVKPHSSLVGKNLIDSHLRRDFGIIIVAIKKTSGEMIFNPMPLEKLEAGDVIVVLGKTESLKQMNDVINLQQ